jgi:beta-RFAP synthase
MPADAPRSIFVSAPARLHFGLLRFEQPVGPSYGGLGMMVDRPRVELELAAADHWGSVGVASHLAEDHARQVLVKLPANESLRACQLRIHSAIPVHHGLGAGTQLALAVAYGVCYLAGLPEAPGTAQLASMVGRGRRSAVGSYGFRRGGLIWEKGRLPGQRLGALAGRVEVPDAWRILLVAPSADVGRSGESEHDAFAALPPVPPTVSETLVRLAEDRILPAAAAGDLDDFGEAVYEYGRLAGECFAPVQGGPYSSAEIAKCVDSIRALGVRGVGQSSWGPIVFAIVATMRDADSLVKSLKQQATFQTAEIQVARPDNRGVVIDLSWQSFRQVAASD